MSEPPPKVWFEEQAIIRVDPLRSGSVDEQIPILGIISKNAYRVTSVHIGKEFCFSITKADEYRNVQFVFEAPAMSGVIFITGSGIPCPSPDPHYETSQIILGYELGSKGDKGAFLHTDTSNKIQRVRDTVLGREHQ